MPLIDAWDSLTGDDALGVVLDEALEILRRGNRLYEIFPLTGTGTSAFLVEASYYGVRESALRVIRDLDHQLGESDD